MTYEESHDGCFTIDVEDWFHILDTPAAPTIEQWDAQESRVAKNTQVLLDLMAKHEVKSTMFWLGWAAERNKDLVRVCHAAGHEIASHGYEHVLAYEVGRKAFREDIRRGKEVLEDMIGDEVQGFRAAGFSTRNDTDWTFSEIKAVGYRYDSSVFPSSRGHGGMSDSRLEPHHVHTEHGDLLEFPQSMIAVCGKRISLFGGGYLRLAPLPLIRCGIAQLHKENRPLILYIHPREIDPLHPRLPLSAVRKFKCYNNLKSTLPKLEWCCKNLNFITMAELTGHYANSKEAV